MAVVLNKVDVRDGESAAERVASVLLEEQVDGGPSASGSPVPDVIVLASLRERRFYAVDGGER